MSFKMLAENDSCENRPNDICSCDGACSGYGTRSNCPPLIVLATMAVSQVAFAHACIVKLLGTCDLVVA